MHTAEAQMPYELQCSLIKGGLPEGLCLRGLLCFIWFVGERVLIRWKSVKFSSLSPLFCDKRQAYFQQLSWFYLGWPNKEVLCRWTCSRLNAGFGYWVFNLFKPEWCPWRRRKSEPYTISWCQIPVIQEVPNKKLGVIRVFVFSAIM